MAIQLDKTKEAVAWVCTSNVEDELKKVGLKLDDNT